MLKKVSVGTVAARGKTWFPELSDKSIYVMAHYMCIYMYEYVHLCALGRSTKTHLYWCMENAGGNHVTLRERIMNISKHYQVTLLPL